MSELKSEIVERVFKYGSEKIVDPDPSLTSSAALKKLAERRTEFLNSSLSGPKYENGKMVYRIERSAGTKG